MSLKLKALGLAMFAALAIGAVSVVSAGADTGGVMHSDVEWTHITGEQEIPVPPPTVHDNRLIDHVQEDAVQCKVATFTANVAAKTATEVTATAHYTECETTNNGYPTNVNMNGCHFVLTFTDEAAAKHHTAHLVCPAEKNVKISINPPIVGECHTYIPSQTPTTGGVVYTQIEIAGKKALTLDVTIQGITNTKEETGFGCGGAGGHDNQSTLEATIKVQGKDTVGNPTNISVTTASS
jgi:ketosteroid isomerase-like protein